jgi:hypothetical protein
MRTGYLLLTQIAVIVSALYAGTPASASPSGGGSPSLALLHLKRDEPYSVARAQMVREQWTPVRSAGERGFVNDILRAGWVEVSNCSGTGLSFCTFDWKQGVRCARVTTYGEYLPERGAPKVHDAKVGPCAKVLSD